MLAGRGECTAQGGPAHATLPWETLGPSIGVRRRKTHKGPCWGPGRARAAGRTDGDSEATAQHAEPTKQSALLVTLSPPGRNSKATSKPCPQPGHGAPKTPARGPAPGTPPGHYSGQNQCRSSTSLTRIPRQCPLYSENPRSCHPTKVMAYAFLEMNQKTLSGLLSVQAHIT